MLDDLHRELWDRGHRFVRYTDDLRVFVRSERSNASRTCGVPLVCLACELQRWGRATVGHDDRPCPSVCLSHLRAAVRLAGSARSFDGVQGRGAAAGQYRDRRAYRTARRREHRLGVQEDPRRAVAHSGNGSLPRSAEVGFPVRRAWSAGNHPARGMPGRRVAAKVLNIAHPRNRGWSHDSSGRACSEAPRGAATR